MPHREKSDFCMLIFNNKGTGKTAQSVQSDQRPFHRLLQSMIHKLASRKILILTRQPKKSGCRYIDIAYMKELGICIVNRLTFNVHSANLV